MKIIKAKLDVLVSFQYDAEKPGAYFITKYREMERELAKCAAEAAKRISTEGMVISVVPSVRA